MINKLLMSAILVLILTSCGRRATLIPPAPDAFPREYPNDAS